MLNRRNFHYFTKKLNASPSIDLFALRLNAQLFEFLSYRQDPESKAVNAFTQSWTDLQFYAYPPFICLPGVFFFFFFLSGFSFTNIHDSRDSRGRGRVSI